MKAVTINCEFSLPHLIILNVEYVTNLKEFSIFSFIDEELTEICNNRLGIISIHVYSLCVCLLLSLARGGHIYTCCTDTHDRDQSEIKQSRHLFALLKSRSRWILSFDSTHSWQSRIKVLLVVQLRSKNGPDQILIPVVGVSTACRYICARDHPLSGHIPHAKCVCGYFVTML